ncbi:Otubain, Ubiquitin thioesterase Otubain, Peptidase C65, otubain isoform 1 [Hibiscus syriacus]|uniref:Otubain, Ubiquitin thioesterase Otubain, Peptidase C65, otubain isoform 1 n=1 Tax=Hibiscus syriacus TaxID=106335 RepID=A0A6A2XZP5_HIBSY|nr:Otubain, Ubiquitin thioesterase Otubain, Peptidase C65, otubain isoform 1 [Hibiscus syriacus]
MRNQDGVVADGEKESAVSISISEVDDWGNFADDDIMQQQSAIHAEEAKKVPLVGDKEPLSMLAAEYESGSPILLEKIKPLLWRLTVSKAMFKNEERHFKFCISSVEPMGEESDRVHITALSDALGVPIRVVYFDQSSCDVGGVNVNHHDFLPPSGDKSNAASGSTVPVKPFITLLYRPGHYGILYPK